MWFDATPSPPVPSDPQAAARVLHTRKRRHVLYGTWRELLLQRMELMIGNVRADAWGEPDMTANALRQISAQQAVLYDGRPDGPRVLTGGPRRGMIEDPVTVLHPSDTLGTGPAAVLADAVREAQLWPLMQRVQRDTLGMREMVVRVDVTAAGQLLYRPVFPDVCHVVLDPIEPKRLRVFAEARLRDEPSDGGAVCRWFWDVIEVTSAGGVYKVVRDVDGMPSEDPADDMSAVFLTDDMGRRAPQGGLRGDLFPFGGNDPFMPAVLFHGAKTHAAWDPFEWIEIYEGTLNLGVYWSFWGHILRACSWPQRYAAGITVRATGTRGRQTTTRLETVTDPSLLAMFDVDPDFEGQPLIGQFQAGGDPVAFADAITKYENRLMGFAGISSSDVQRVSGDPRSGYALAISRKAKMESSQRLAPVFDVSTAELLNVSARLLNLWAAVARLTLLPDTGWGQAFLALAREEEPGRMVPEPADTDTDTDTDE